MRYPTTVSMMVIILLISGCSQNRQIPMSADISTVSNTLTTTTVSTLDLSDSPSTTSLKDQPVENWPRYEFKELGFSVRLPFQGKQIVSNSEEETGSGCLFATHKVTASVETKNGVRDFLGSFERYRCFPYEGIEYRQSLTEIQDFDIKNNGMLEMHFTALTSTPEVGVIWPNDPEWQASVEQKIIVDNYTIYTFNPYFYYQTNEKNTQNYPNQAAVFKLKNNPYFKAVLIQFRKSDLSPAQFNSILTSIRHL